MAKRICNIGAGGRTINEFLPSDLIISDIIPRLSLKSISQCKAVCKKWYVLLNDINFIKNYEKNPPFTILFSFLFHKQILYLLQVSQNGYSCDPSRIYPNRFPEDLCSFQIEGTSNGLICFSCSNDRNISCDDIYVCNPITGDNSLLPRNQKFSNRLPWDNIYHGFGYISASNQFKVLRIHTRESGHHIRLDAQIFTVGVDVGWRHVPSFATTNFRKHGDAIAFNGFYHWILSSDHRNDFINTFDLGEEKVGPDIPSPRGIGRGNLLIVLNDFLSIVDLSVSSEFAIWTMKQYGIEDSWTKEVVSTSWCPSDVWKQINLPVARLGNGNILFLGEMTTMSIVSSLSMLKERNRRKLIYLGLKNVHHIGMPYMQ